MLAIDTSEAVSAARGSLIPSDTVYILLSSNATRPDKDKVASVAVRALIEV